MIILEDTRQQASKHKYKHKWFEENGIEVIRTKLMCGDYTLPTNQSICVDTKFSILEICGNVCQQHDRFRRELLRSKEAGIKLVILVENEDDVSCLEDIIFWENPRRHMRKKVDGKWQSIKTNATTGETLYKILTTLQEKYGCEFQFCTKEETGKRILEILSNDT